MSETGDIWQLARVFIRSFDGKELLCDGVATIRPDDSLESVRRIHAVRHGVKDENLIRLEIIE